MLAATSGASFGGLLPSALPSTYKLLTAGYFACAVTCNAFIVYVRTGDERMPSFQMVHGVIPFVASFLSALGLAVSRDGERVEAAAMVEDWAAEVTASEAAVVAAEITMKGMD